MQCVRFDPGKGRQITQFGSQFTHVRLAKTSTEAHVSAIYLGPSGVVGWHQAATRQLLLVVNGTGWVRTGEDKIFVGEGMAILWESGEWHETGTDTELIAIVIESDGLDLSQWIKVPNA